MTSSSPSSPSSPTTEKAKLSLIHVWAVGVGSAIGGNFLGWNQTLEAGLGGATIGLLLSFCLYISLCLCIAEMSAQTTYRVNGAHSFVADSPLGTLGAYLTGIAELIKVITTGSVCVFAIGAYVGAAFGDESAGMEFVTWIISYLIFTLFNIVGLELSLNFQVTSGSWAPLRCLPEQIT